MKGKKESAVRIEPLIIFVGESDHGDMSYGSLVEQIAKTAEKSGLVYQIFSEFPSQARKEETQQPLRSQQGEERFARIKEVISPKNENFVEIGSLGGREETFDKIMAEVGDLKASELKEHLLSRFSDKSRFPFLSELYADGDIFRNFDAAKETFLEELDKDSERIVRDRGHWVGALNSKLINEKMAEDLRQKRNPQADVVIILAGSPHIPELGYLLEKDFSEESSKFFVSNKDRDPNHAGYKSIYFEATEASLSKAGTLIGFEVESDGEAKLPSQINQAISKQRFSRIDNPQENLVLETESKLRISEAIAAAHIDRIKSLDEEKRQSFMPKLAGKLRVELPALIAAAEDKEKLSALFFNLKDEELITFNKDKDGLPAIKPTNLTAPAIQEYCDTIDFRGVMVINYGEDNQTKISNYHKGTQSDPQDKPFATHSVSKLIGGVTICKMIADEVIAQDALDRKLELAPEVKEKLPEEILKHLEERNVTLRDVMTHHSGLGGYLDPELKEGQKGYEAENTKLGYGVNGYSGYVRQKLEKGEAVEVPTSPQDYLKYSERETYKYGEFKYSDLGIVLASLSAEHHYNKTRDPSESKSFEEIIKETLITPAGVEKFAAQKPADAIFHSDDPIAPYITGTAGCGYWTNLDGLVKIGKQIGKMWKKDKEFRDAIQNCGQEFYDEKLNIIRHPGGIDSSKTLLSVDLNNGSVVATEERRLGSDFPFPGWGVVATARDLGKETTSGLLKEGDKMDRMRQDMSELQPEDKGSWAQKILEKRAQEKESQNRNDGR